MKIIKEELRFEENLKKRLEFICEFSKVTPTFVNGSIRKIEKTNISYIEPHRVIVKDTTFLVFNYSNDVYISTEDQAREGFSIPEQKERLEAYCKFRNYEIVDYYEDAGISAKTGNHRPEFERLKADIESKRINTLVSLKLDRITRSVYDWEELITFLDKNEAYIDCVNDDINTTTAKGNVSGTTIHFDETSPHMHVVGVPVIDNCKKGMKKQVGKSKLFTKESLTAIQDKMRNDCIKSYNKFYGVDSRLKTKQKGRNQDINVKEMDNYREIKKRLEQQKQKLENANKRTEKLDNSSKGIIELLDSLKPMPFNKNNSQISNENIENIKDYIKNVTDVTQTVRSVNDLNIRRSY